MTLYKSKLLGTAGIAVSTLVASFFCLGCSHPGAAGAEAASSSAPALPDTSAPAAEDNGRIAATLAEQASAGINTDAN
jgi:hypothetical protein